MKCMARFISFIFFFISISVYSQSPKEKGLETINKQKAEAYIGFLASDILEGRKAGERGSRIAAEYIKAELQSIGINYTIQPFKAYSQGKKKRYYVHPDSITKYKAIPDHQSLNLHNILGLIEGKNNSEYVIIGAHYDHLGIDETLDGDKIYNGADDNASGVSAVLQIAKAFVESGQQPERNVIFAFWDGEEMGLLGSEYFMSNTSYTIKAYLNFDMIGRNNDESRPEQVVYFYTSTHPAFGDWLKSDIKVYNLKLKPDYRSWDKPVSGSDNASFAKRGIPIIWYHTDGHPDYHKPSDHVDKINWEKLVDITKAAYLNLWNLANLKIY